MKPKVASSKCIGCAYCKVACKYDCIDVHVVSRINRDCCVECLACLKVCPVRAITI